MKTLFFIALLAIVLVGLPILGLTDAAISSGDTASLDREMASTVSNAGSSSASAAITITMYTGDGE